MKQNTSKKCKAQVNASSEVLNVQQTLSNKKHNSTNIVKLEEDASKNKREPDNRDHAKKPFASNSNDNVISGTPLIILGHHHFDETSQTRKTTMMKEDDDDEPFGSSVVSKELPPVLGFTTNTVSLIDTNEHSYIMSQAPPLDMQRHTDIESIKRTCRDFARGHLFRYTKFWDPETFGLADPKKGGLPYLLASHYHLSKENILTAWRFFARLLQRAHMDHRNNVIKKIKKTYISKSSSA